VYEVDGNLLKQIDAAGYASGSNDANRYGTTYVYDEDGRVVNVTSPEAAVQGKTSKTYIYNALGHLISMVDGEGYKTAYEVDLWGRVTSVLDAEGHQTHNVYDLAGNLISSKDGNGHETEYTYNRFNLVSSIKDPLGQYIYYHYDLDGKVIRMTDREGNDTVYTYNTDGKLTNVLAEKTGETRQYLYNKDGSLLAAINDQIIDRYAYAKNGNLLTQERNGQSVLTYTYNVDNQINSVKDVTGSTTAYTYDELGRMHGVQNNGNDIASYQYNNNSMLSRVNYASGTNMQYSYDKDYRVTSVVSKNSQGTVLDSNTYSYDNNGNIVTAIENGQTNRYAYNRINQLTSADFSQAADESFQYDSAGNRTSRTRGGVVTNYTYDANNRLTGVNDGTKQIAYTYDANGNMTQETQAGATRSYAYNGFNQIVETTLEDGSWMRYSYDPTGLRSSVSVNGVQTNFTFDRQNIIAETTASGQKISSYVRGNGLLAVVDPQSRIFNYVSNGRGDVKALVDAKGLVVNSYSYLAFGETTVGKENVHNLFKYAGEQLDTLTDQYYLRARNYAPGVGRFITEDTYKGQIVNPLSMNLYSYVENNPLSFIDPSGMAPVVIGYVYIIEGQFKGESVTYIGSTAQDIKKRMGKHEWKAVVQDPNTTVKAIEVKAELDIEGSGRGTRFSARNEALRTAEQQIIDSYEKKKIELANKIAAATKENTKIWDARHAVEFSIKSAKVALKGGKRVPSVMSVLDIYSTAMDLIKSEYVYAPYYMQDEGGVFTIRKEVGGLTSFFKTTYYKTYQSSCQIVEINKEEYNYWANEGEALWGTLDGKGNFVPGLFNPYLESSYDV